MSKEWVGFYNPKRSKEVINKASFSAFVKCSVSQAHEKPIILHWLESCDTTQKKRARLTINFPLTSTDDSEEQLC